MKKSKLAHITKLLAGETLPTRYKFHLRASEEIILQALEDNEAININKMVKAGVNVNDIRVCVSRMRKKLPKGVTIKSKYGGFYYLNKDDKEILRKHKR